MRHAVAPSAADLPGELPLPDVARALQTVLGSSLVALIAGVHDPRTIQAWERGTRLPSAQAQTRLRNAWQVTQVLLEREAPDTIQAWFIGMDPFLDDEQPAVMLRRDPDRVVRAARSFLAYG